MAAPIVDELNELTELEYDAVAACEQAIARIDDTAGDVRAALESCRSEHERHITELQRVVVSLGGTPVDRGRDGATLAGPPGTLDALKAMQGHETLTNKAYSKAADLRMPLSARQVVGKNFEDERRHLAAIKAHIARFDESEVLPEPVEDIDEESDTDRDASPEVPAP